MNNYYRQSRTLLLGSTAIFLVIAGLCTPARAEFDPNAGAEPADETSSLPLPDTRVLYAPKTGGMRSSAPAPISAPTSTLPVNPFAQSAPTTRPGYTGPTLYSATPKMGSPINTPSLPPLSTVEPMPTPAPAPIVTPEPTGSIPAPTPTLAPAPFAAPALATSPVPLPPPPTIPGFVAPAPLIAPAPVAAAKPAPSPATPSAPAPAATTEAAPLAKQTKTILSHIPSKMDAPKAEKTSKLAIDRTNPDVMTVLGKDTQPAQYDSVGLSIKVSRPGLDTNFELNRAYTALMGGDAESAIEIYKNVLSTEPKNQDALFGLAATYHRLGDIEKARPYYGQLLKVNPNHREGLNNFLVLVSDESPQEALAELDRLAERNPTFSPIPAQQAVVLEKLGATKEAEAKMLHALELAPDSLTYKYNLAIMLDRHGDYAGAAKLYTMLITASLRGEQVPASIETMQKRLNYITSSLLSPATQPNNAM